MAYSDFRIEPWIAKGLVSSCERARRQASAVLKKANVLDVSHSGVTGRADRARIPNQWSSATSSG